MSAVTPWVPRLPILLTPWQATPGERGLINPDCIVTKNEGEKKKCERWNKKKERKIGGSFSCESCFTDLLIPSQGEVNYIRSNLVPHTLSLSFSLGKNRLLICMRASVIKQPERRWVLEVKGQAFGSLSLQWIWPLQLAFISWQCQSMAPNMALIYNYYDPQYSHIWPLYSVV